MLRSDAVQVCKASEVKLPEKKVSERETPNAKAKPGRKRKIREGEVAPVVEDDLYDDAAPGNLDAAQNPSAIPASHPNVRNKFLDDTLSQSSEDPELDNLGMLSVDP